MGKWLGALCVMSFLCGCHSTTTSQSGSLVVTTPVLEYFARQLTQGPEQPPVALAFQPQGKCLHEHQVSSQEIRTLCSARLVVAQGAGFEPFLQETMKQCPAVPVVELGNGCADLQVAGKADPHAWFGAAATDCLIHKLSMALQQQDTLRRTSIAANESKLRQQIKQTWDSLRLEYASLQNTPVISFHGAYGYLARELGMHVVASFGEEVEDATPSAQAVAELIAQARAQKVKLLLVGETESPDLAATVARETGVRVVPLLNMLEGLDTTDSFAYSHVLRLDLERITKQ